MNLPQQPPSSEEPEQKPALHSSEESPIQTVPASDLRSDEAEKQPILSTSEDIPTQPAAAFEPQTDKSEQFVPDEAEAPTQVWSETSAPDETQSPDWTDTSTQDWSATPPTEENEEFDEAQIVPVPSQPSSTGIFIRRSILIAAAIILVLAAIIVSLLLFVNRPKDPPADWIASAAPTTTTGTREKIVYYLHWTNQNGELKGQLQLAGVATNGSPQSLTAPTTGMYNRDNHIIYVVVVVNGNPDTLMGKINDSNDTLTLNQVGATNKATQIVFHTGNANDYKQATKNLSAPKK